MIKPIARSNSSLAYQNGFKPALIRLPQGKMSALLGITVSKPFSASLQRYASTYDKIDKKHEDRVEHEKIQAHPEQVSSTSTVHQVFHEQGIEEPEKDEDMLAGVWSDWVSPSHLRRARRHWLIESPAHDQGDIRPQ